MASALQMNAVVAIGALLVVAWCALTLWAAGTTGLRTRIAALTAPTVNPGRVSRPMVAALAAWWCWNLARW